MHVTHDLGFILYGCQKEVRRQGYAAVRMPPIATYTSTLYSVTMSFCRQLSSLMNVLMYRKAHFDVQSQLEAVKQWGWIFAGHPGPH